MDNTVTTMKTSKAMRTAAVVTGIAITVAVVSSVVMLCLLLWPSELPSCLEVEMSGTPEVGDPLAKGMTFYGYNTTADYYLDKGFSKISAISTTTARCLIPFESGQSKFVIVPQKAMVIPSDPPPTSLDAGDSTNAKTNVWLLNGEDYKLHQQLPTPGAHGGALQEFGGVLYLSVPSVRTGTFPNYDEHVNSSVWVWNDKTRNFTLLQQFALKAAKFSSLHVYNNELFAFFACGSALSTNGTYDPANASPVYKLNSKTGMFDQIQSIPTYGAFDMEMFEAGGLVYLGVVDATVGTTLFTWDSATGQFGDVQWIATDIQGREIQSFAVDGVDYLLVTNLLFGITLYRLQHGTGWSKFIKTQFLQSTLGGAHGITVFQNSLGTWVFIANYIEAGSTQSNPLVRTSSTVYKWTGSGLSWVTDYPSSASASTNVWANGSSILAAVANEATIDFKYDTESSIYSLDLSKLT